MENVLVLFERHQCATKLTEDKRAALERDATERTGKKCIFMPRHIVDGILADNVLFLWSYRSYRNGGRAEEEAQLSDKTGIRCVLMDPHIGSVLAIRSPKEKEL